MADGLDFLYVFGSLECEVQMKGGRIERGDKTSVPGNVNDLVWA